MRTFVLMFVVSCAMQFVQSTTLLAAEKKICGPAGDQLISTANAFSGQGTVRFSKDGMYVLALSATGDGKASHVFRIALIDGSGLSQAMSGLSREVMNVSIIDRSGNFYRELEVVFPQHPEYDMIFYVDAQDCTPADDVQRRLQHQDGVYAAQALSVSRTSADHEITDAVQGFATRPVLVEEPNGPTLAPPVICMSGGPGARACSIDLGSVAAESCAASCLPPSYACCRPGSGADCSCLMPSGSDPVPATNPGGGSDDG